MFYKSIIFVLIRDRHFLSLIQDKTKTDAVEKRENSLYSGPNLCFDFSDGGKIEVTFAAFTWIVLQRLSYEIVFFCPL